MEEACSRGEEPDRLGVCSARTSKVWVSTVGRIVNFVGFKEFYGIGYKNIGPFGPNTLLCMLLNYFDTIGIP